MILSTFQSQFIHRILKNRPNQTKKTVINRQITIQIQACIQSITQIAFYHRSNQPQSIQHRITY